MHTMVVSALQLGNNGDMKTKTGDRMNPISFATNLNGMSMLPGSDLKSYSLFMCKRKLKTKMNK